MELDDLISATERTARAGVARIAELARAVIAAHVAGDGVRLQSSLGNLVGIAAANYELQSLAAARLRERIGQAAARRGMN